MKDKKLYKISHFYGEKTPIVAIIDILDWISGKSVGSSTVLFLDGKYRFLGDIIPKKEQKSILQRIASY